MRIEPSHRMISAGLTSTDYAEVDVREVFYSMLEADESHIRCELIKQGWCPPNGPNNPAEETCNCCGGAHGCLGDMDCGTYGGY